MRQLREIAASRQQQIQSNSTKEEASELIRPAVTWMHQQNLPKVLIKALGRCLWRRTAQQSIDQLCALAISSFPRGEEFMWSSLAKHYVFPTPAPTAATARYP